MNAWPLFEKENQHVMVMSILWEPDSVFAGEVNGANYDIYLSASSKRK